MNKELEKIIYMKTVEYKALLWWNNLTKSQQNDIEFKTYGYGEEFEDNTLTDADIIFMYCKK